MTEFIESIKGSSMAKTSGFKLVFQEYKPVLFNNIRDCKEWYLRGAVGIKEQKIANFNKVDLLLNLVNLASVILKNNGRRNDLDYVDEIIDWCKKYGLPYECDYFRKHYYEDKNGTPQNIKDYISIEGEKPTTGYDGFSLREFKRRIHILHDYFQLWYGLTFNELDRTLKYADIIGDNQGSSKILDTTSLKDSLAVFISANMGTGLELIYDSKNDSYSIIPASSDLISVAHYQLALLAVNKGIKPVRFCTVCGKTFEVEHASKKICEPCNKEYHRLKMQESRIKKGLQKKQNKEM